MLITHFRTLIPDAERYKPLYDFNTQKWNFRNFPDERKEEVQKIQIKYVSLLMKGLQIMLKTPWRLQIFKIKILIVVDYNNKIKILF